MRRLTQIGIASIFLGVLLIAVKPELLERPTIRKLLTLTEGTKDANFQWRIQQRWPHFVSIALEHPLLGTGTVIDPTLGKAANTPHNGYIAVAVKNGLPALGIMVLFAWLSLLRILRAVLHARDHASGIQALCIGAALIGLLTHNLVEYTFMRGFIAKLYWLLIAYALTAFPSDAAPRPEPVSTDLAS